MNSQSSIRLGRWLPVLMAMAFLLLTLSTSYWRNRQAETTVISNAQALVQNRMADEQHRIEQLLRMQQAVLLTEEIAQLGSTPEVISVALVNDQGRVLFSATPTAINQLMRDSLPAFDATKLRLIQNERHFTMVLDTDNARIVAYQPIVLAELAGKIRPDLVGGLLLEYDLSLALGKGQHEAIVTTLLELGFTIILMLVVMLILRHWLTRPLVHLHETVMRIGQGSLTNEISIIGEGELADLGNAINNMQNALALTITERQEANESLRKSEENYQSIFRNSPDAYLIMELEGGRVVDCNFAAERMLKGSREEIIGETPDVLSPPTQPDGRTSMESVPEKIERAMETGYNRFEWVHRRLDGENFWADVTISVINYQNQKVLLVAWRDISEKKQLELTLQKQQKALKIANQNLQLLNSMVESSADPFYVLDVNDGFRLVLTNQSGCEHYGLPKEKLLSMRVPDWDPDVGPEQLQQLLAAVKEKGHLSIETRHYHSSGNIIPVEVSINHLKDESGEYVYGYINDISSRREMEKSLLQAKESAEALTKSKSQFLANMSHEIRTPMNAIIGLSHLALNKQMPSDVRDYLEKINHSSEGLLGILNDILDFSKMEAGKLIIENGHFNLNTILNNLNNMFSARAEEKHLEFGLEVSDDVPTDLIGDALRLQQILTNLVGNAFKFTERGKVAIKVLLQDAEGSHARLHFRVCDTGIGMSREDQEKLFKPFSQVDTSATRQFRGTGLGLVISHNLLNLMGGEFQIESAPGKGSIFSFDLLFSVASNELHHEVNHRHEKRRAGTLALDLRELGQALSGTRILVAEDNQINQQVVKEFLKLSGVNVDIANDGKEALQLLERHRYDAILMDVHMPEMGGVEATESVRKQPQFKELPIIALTAGVTQEEREVCEAIGMNDFIAKPVNPEALIKTLCEWIKPKVASAPPSDEASNDWADIEDDLPGFDLRMLKTMIGGSSEILQSLLQTFFADCAGESSVIMASIQKPDLVVAEKQLHRLKGAAGNLGAKALHQACEALDAQLKKGSYSAESLQVWLKTFDETMLTLGNMLVKWEEK